MRHLLFAVLLVTPALAQEKPKPAPLPGEAMIEKYFQAKVKAIADQCLTDLSTKEAWEKKRPELRKQFLDMMGLWPLPDRTPLNAKVTGTVDGEGFTVEKLVFESRPGLYVTANVYKPKPAPTIKLPAILYVCGHGNTVEKGVSYGSKVSYQYHPAWFAAHGYVCIILDTLQLGEIPGEHHGTYKLKQWWWQSVGYTPGGVELWNAIRALDYLETRPDVDAKKIGVTGRSGGGATSWWVLAADDRPACFVPVAGIVDLHSHVCEGDTERLKKGVIAGHCDCMYMVNTHRWDFPLVAALAAPKPLLLGNSDADDIFPVPGYRRLADKVSKVYKLYGAEEKFQLLETKGPHKDTPELRIGINKWMNRWLKNDTTTKVEDDLPPKLTPQQLKVLDKIPDNAINAKVPDVLYTPVSLTMPESKAEAKSWWEKKRFALQKDLTATSFRAWPQRPGEVKTVLKEEVQIDGKIWLRGYEYESEPGITLRFVHVSLTKKEDALEAARKVQEGLSFVPRVLVLDEQEWDRYCRFYGSGFAKCAGVPPAQKGEVLPKDDKEAQMERWFGAMESPVYVLPRGIGPTRWAAPGSVEETQIRRRFPLIGETLESGQVWDVRRVIQATRTLPEFKTASFTLSPAGPMTWVAVYASLYESGDINLDLVSPSESFRSPDSPVFLGAAKVLDHPIALTMAASRSKVTMSILHPETEGWDWEPWHFPMRLKRKTLDMDLFISPYRKR